ncbi:hypothetical protein [Teichococcus aestuarii]|uniref:hypothetical protein n=1 Tax=Teichococcus aestuarii TaxID=568898 RepID=UPI00360A45CF
MRRAGRLAAILAAVPLLVWPAFLNGYPLLFSDTGAFLAQTVEPLMIWDKPWIYGPLLHLFHWEQTLWAPLLAQGLALSHLLWLTQRVLRATGQGTGATPAAHLLLCAALATLTALPWVAALLMPDILTPWRCWRCSCWASPHPARCPVARRSTCCCSARSPSRRTCPTCRWPSRCWCWRRSTPGRCGRFCGWRRRSGWRCCCCSAATPWGMGGSPCRPMAPPSCWRG